MTKENELLPCPFCGGKEFVVERSDIPWGVLRNKIEWWKLRCCGCLSGADYPTKDGLISKWNTRHAPQSVDVEGLKKDYGAGFDMSVYRSSNNEGWNACLDYLTTHYDIVKKSEETHDKNR